jgi:putative ABC transport system permease protein
MVQNYFKSAFRSLRRNRNYTLINIAGLSAGIAICLVIFIIIRFETSFDGFHSKKERIYRVLTEYHHPGDKPIFYGAAAPTPLAGIIKHEFPELKKTSGIFASGNDQVLILDENGQTEKKFKEKKGLFAVEPDFFDIFDFPWLAGSPSGSLRNLNSAVLTKETAEKYFGDWKKAMGKSIKLDNRAVFKITGILASIPPNTDFQFKIIVPYDFLGFSKSTDWGSSSSSLDCYVLLPPGESKESFDLKLRALFKRYRPADDKDELVIQSLSKVHYYDSYSHTENFLGRTIDPKTIRILWLIGLFIIIIACVNFINLSTAQAVNRAREVGVRKVLGSRDWQLKIKFLLETLLLVIASLIIGLIICFLTLKPIATLLDLPLSTNVFYSPAIILFLLIGIIAVTLLAGFYPSVVLSAFNPINALKSRQAVNSSRGISLRRALVIFQFVIAQGLIIGVIIMVRQMNYFNNGSMGFEKDAIVTVSYPWDTAVSRKIDFLRDKLIQMPGVKDVSFNSSLPATDENNWTGFKFDHAAKSNELYSIMKWVDPQYLKLYDIGLVAGRNFISDTAHEFLINEELMRKLGYREPGAIINKEIDLWNGFVKGPIVGVVKDFHSTGFKDNYSPVLFSTRKKSYNNAAIKLSSGHAPATLKAIETLWNQEYPDYVFEYQFLDEAVNGFYKQETELFQLYKIFAAIAIFLGCLGLYGLASFMAVQRIKEVGIRKVLGATVNNIVALFSKEFIILIGIAFLIASPIAWYFMNKWLHDYVYRIDISWWIFLIAWLLAAVIALATISVQAIKAAMSNPVKSLRTE